MRVVFYVAVVLLVAFEAANVYFIMPMPFSQRMQSIDLAYFLHTWRWVFRALLVAAAVAGAPAAFRVASWRKVFPVIAVAPCALLIYGFNFKMAADKMFLEPTTVRMAPASGNVVDSTRLVVGIVVDGDARAYPLQFIGYHHQVRDTAGGKPVMVSYCTVCRTGRVFSPLVDGQPEVFRLVGMDHFNAMFEDKRTGSWWRQATGEAITGDLEGKVLAEFPSVQVTLGQWLAMHPTSLIMQPDSASLGRYPRSNAYESGASRSDLTGTDTVSWSDKAWVVGVRLNGESKAYDWNRLKKERVVNDVVGGTPIVVVVAPDSVNFFAYQRPDSSTRFTLRGDSLLSRGRAYHITGRGPRDALQVVSASQEFWHSWRTFQPNTRTW